MYLTNNSSLTGGLINLPVQEMVWACSSWHGVVTAREGDGDDPRANGLEGVAGLLLSSSVLPPEGWSLMVAHVSPGCSGGRSVYTEGCEGAISAGRRSTLLRR